MATLKTACVLGRGMIGTAIKEKLTLRGVKIVPYPNNTIQAVFDMRGTTHHLYNDYGDFLEMEALSRFTDMMSFCLIRGIKYIWPSSALVLEKDSLFAEERRKREKVGGALALRLFPVYGREAHKGDYSSVVYKWTTQMARGERPVVFGDGTQGRDFIHAKDVAIQAADLWEETGVINIGTGKLTKFNDIVETINEVLGTNIKPIYQEAPPGYSAGICSPNPIKTTISLKEGIRHILNE